MVLVVAGTYTEIPAADVKEHCRHFTRCNGHLAPQRVPAHVSNIEHIIVVADPGASLIDIDLPVDDETSDAPTSEPVEATTFGGSYINDAYQVAKDKLVAHFEKDHLTPLVSRAGGNISRAARLEGIDRTTLHRLIEKHELRRDEYSGSVA